MQIDAISIAYIFMVFAISAPLPSLLRRIQTQPGLIKRFICHKQQGFVKHPFHNNTSLFYPTSKRTLSTTRNMETSGKAETLTEFHKIVKGELPCKKVYEDDLVLAFHDIQPVAPTHILLIPKDFDGLSSLANATERHQKVLGHMLLKAAQIAKEHNLGDFRVVVNSGPNAQQTVYYLHMHLMAGRTFNWPPG